MRRIILFLCLAGLNSLIAEEPAKLTELRTIFEKEREKELAVLVDKYVAALERQEIASTKEGDLDAALAYRSEREKWKRSKESAEEEESKPKVTETTDLEVSKNALVLKPKGPEQRTLWSNVPESKIIGIELVGVREADEPTPLLITMVDEGKATDLATVSGDSFGLEPTRVYVKFRRPFRFKGDLHFFFANLGNEASLTLTTRNLRAEFAE